MKQEATGLGIGAMAERCGLSIPTIRYYEDIGLIPQAMRRGGGHRVFSAATQGALLLVKRLRDLGLPLEKIRALVTMTGDARADCSVAHRLAATHLAELREQLLELRVFERNLAALVDNCSAACLGGPASKCSIMKDLADAGRKTLSARCCDAGQANQR